MQRRVLFVEDEESLRELYASLDTVLGEGHEICTAAAAEDGLRLMRENSFDVVVADIAMPQMDGMDFLREVMRTHPESARIVISGFADRLKVAECLAVGHRFFSKPFDFKTLSSLLKGICRYSYLLEGERVRRIVCGHKALPTPPDTYIRLTEALNSEYTNIAEIGRIVRQDAGLSTKLLQIVNSAQFGGGQRIASPTDAVQILGVEALRALMLGTQVFNFYEESPFVKSIFEDLWEHSLKTAVAARKLALLEDLPAKTCDECFLAGLLHDIGKLILAANSEAEYKFVLRAVAKDALSLEHAEQEVYGSTHAQIGAYLLALWGVEDSVIRAVEMHHSLSAAKENGFGPALAVHVAQNLEPGVARESLLDSEALDRAGLLEKVPIWKEILLSGRSVDPL